MLLKKHASQFLASILLCNKLFYPAMADKCHDGSTSGCLGDPPSADGHEGKGLPISNTPSKVANSAPGLRGLKKGDQEIDAECGDIFPDCAECEEGLQSCKRCNTGFFLLDNGQCTACDSAIPHCEECSIDGDTCIVCTDESKQGGYKYELYDDNHWCVAPITFDDLPTPDNGKWAKVPNGYHDLIWSDHWFYMLKSYYPNLGSGLHSGSDPHVSFNEVGLKQVYFQLDDGTFDLKVIQMAPYGYNGLGVKIEGFDANGILKGEKTVTLVSRRQTIAVEFGVDFEDLKQVVITTVRDNQVAMDDIILVV